MSIIQTFGWIALTEAINKIVAPKTFILNTLFAPKTKQHATKKIQIDIKVGNKKLAPFVKRTSGAAVVDKQGFKSETIELPKIRMKKPLTAEDLLFERGVGMPIYVGSSGDINSFRERKIAEELQDIKDRATRRMEWMAAQSLSGVITVSQDDLEIEYDFNMPEANKPALTLGAKWSEVTTADPIANIRTWQSVVQNARGYVPTIAFARTEVINYFLANESVRQLLNLRSIVAGNIDTNKVANETGAKYIGKVEGVDIFEYNETYTDKNGATQPMIPVDRFVLVTPQAENRLHYGAIEDLEAGQNIALPYFAKDWIEKDPSVLWLLAETSPLTVPHEPETIVFAKVY